MLATFSARASVTRLLRLAGGIGTRSGSCRSSRCSQRRWRIKSLTLVTVGCFGSCLTASQTLRWPVGLVDNTSSIAALAVSSSSPATDAKHFRLTVARAHWASRAMVLKAGSSKRSRVSFSRTMLTMSAISSLVAAASRAARRTSARVSSPIAVTPRYSRMSLICRLRVLEPSKRSRSSGRSSMPRCCAICRRMGLGVSRIWRK